MTRITVTIPAHEVLVGDRLSFTSFPVEKATLSFDGYVHVTCGKGRAAYTYSFLTDDLIVVSR